MNYIHKFKPWIKGLMPSLELLAGDGAYRIQDLMEDDWSVL